jgi:hypothetical protein
VAGTQPLLALAWLPADEPWRFTRAAWRALDPAGALLFTAALATLLSFIMNLRQPQWWLLALAAWLFAAPIWRERRAGQPFVDVDGLA